MSGTEPSSRRKRALQWILTAVILVAVSVFGWIVFAPGPTDFAGGRHVTLASYQGQDPTGAELFRDLARAPERLV